MCILHKFKQCFLVAATELLFLKLTAIFCHFFGNKTPTAVRKFSLFCLPATQHEVLYFESGPSVIASLCFGTFKLNCYFFSSSLNSYCIPSLVGLSM